MKNTILFLFILIVVAMNNVASAQTLEFTYQGSLKDGVNPANGNHDFEFALFDSLAGGSQLGSTLTRTNVSVSNGVFAVSLDFGSQFPGATRFLEIRVRPSGGGAFTPLTPRQAVDSSPYSIKSLNAENASNATNAVNATNASQLGGIAANQYVLTGDSRLSDARNPLPNSGNYIQNQNAAPQASSNFSISGNGTADVFNAAAQYNIGGSRVLSIGGTNNVFAGIGAGQTSTGSSNSFFGRTAGFANTAGAFNSFFGVSAGDSNTTGNNNAFFGQNAGQANTTGGSNAFFGETAGFSNTTGFGNSFLGPSAGLSTTTGTQNTFVGREAGATNTTGSSNTIIGTNANVGANNLTFATAIGSDAVVNASNAMVLGRNLDTVQVPGNLAVTGFFFANGSNITNLSASTISTGTLDNARLGVVPIANGGTGSATGSGAALTNLNASSITTGTLDNARLGVVPVANGGTGSATQNFVDLTNAQTIGGNKAFSGTLSGNIVNAATQFNMSGGRVLSVAGKNNIFAGVGAGTANTTGTANSFFGRSAGQNNTEGDTNSFFGNSAGSGNTTGARNSFFGGDAGRLNTTASDNSFFGNSAGEQNTSGFSNSFFGGSAGLDNTTGHSNSFVGVNAGRSNTTGDSNAFFGQGSGQSNITANKNSFFGNLAGSLNSTGSDNSFFGEGAGNANTTGSNNTLIGSNTDIGSSNLTNATAIGFRSFVGQSNALVLGSINGVNSANADTSVGIGTTAPAARFHVIGNSSAAATPVTILQSAGSQVPLSFRSGGSEVARVRADSQGNIVLATLNGTDKDIYFRAGDDSVTDMFIQSSSGNVGIGTTAPEAELHIRGTGSQEIMIESSAVSGIKYSLVSTQFGEFQINDSTNSLSRLSILSNGNVGLGTISPADKLDVNGDIRVGTGTTGCVKDSNGTVLTGTCSSDLRFKKSVASFGGVLGSFLKLQPVHFYWRSVEFKDKHFGTRQSYGLIAQDVETAFPDLVTTDEQGYKVVNYGKLPLLTIQAIKEQQAQIDAQKKEIAMLKAALCEINPNLALCKGEIK